MSQQVSRGWNIKCFDKVKLTHLPTSCRLHANSFAYKSRSYNTAVTTHKVRDESDWFVVLRLEDASMSYHFRYDDQILLSNVDTKKCVHLSEDIESPVSKNMEVSLCDQADRPCIEDLWIVQRADSSQDDYWRVGELVRFRNRDSGAFLCSHRRKMQQNDDYQVFGQRVKIEGKEGKGEASQNLIGTAAPFHKHEDSLWLVSEITPFIYTASISEQKKIKLTEQAEELNKLKTTLHAIPRKQAKKMDETQEILKMENRRLQQIEAQRRKMEQHQKKISCWQRYFCCCCIDNDPYSKLAD